MGSWEVGLYADDFALDLRSSIRGMARLPLEGGELLNLLRASYAEASDDPSSEEYARFWLVVGDQFQRRGIACAAVTRTTLEVIDGGLDGKTLAALGADNGALRKRVVITAELRARLIAGPSSQPRRTLKKPQNLIMQTGDLMVYPTSCGEPFNPFMTNVDESIYKWRQDAWGAMLILRSDVAYGYLAWYWPLIVESEFLEKPTLESLQEAPWTARNPGTCSRAHFKRLQLERLGHVPLADEYLRLVCPERLIRHIALEDISLGNSMGVSSQRPGSRWFNRS